MLRTTINNTTVAAFERDKVDHQRRSLLLGLSGLMVATPGCFGNSGSSGPQAHTAPNVLMLMVDDLNDWVGFLGGHPQVLTPNMDRLAATSTVFRHAYCNAPVCNPSRASMLSGLSVQETRVFDNATPLRQANPDAVLFPEHLARHGYKTTLIGKIGHVHSATETPLPEHLPATNQQCPGPSGAAAFDWAPLDIDEAVMPDYKLASAAIDFLGHEHEQPFFLGVGFIRTHVAWYLPRKYFELYPEEEAIQLPPVPADDLEDLPPEARSVALKFNFHECITSQSLWASAVLGYLASISFADAQIGRVLAALERSPHAHNTVVMLMSDHGFHLGEKFHWHKLALWERSTRIPFLVRNVGQSESAVVDAPVSLIDVMPTVLDLCGGVPAPYPLAGNSLKGLLTEPQMPWNHPVLITKDQHDHAIRTERWRYIRYAGGDRELYDSLNDPDEWINLAGNASYAAVMTELDRLMPAPV